MSYMTHDVTSPEIMGRFKKLLNSMCIWTSKKPGDKKRAFLTQENKSQKV